MRSLLLVVLFLWSLTGMSGSSLAQSTNETKPAASEVPDAASSGTVSGSVVCADTQRPARFARAILVNRKAMLTRAQMPRPGGEPPPEETLIINGTTGIDGHFQIEKVPPGDYYVVAKLGGYLFPTDALDSEPGGQKGTSRLDDLMRGVPLVHVVQGRTSEANVTLHRGGLVAGRVTYDDGSPAVGIRVRIEKDGRPDSMFGFSYMLFQEPMSMAQPGTAITDDEGRYRFSGLLPGAYGVTAFIKIAGTSRMIGTMFSSRAADSSEDVIPVYYPSAFRGADAKTLKIESDDRIADADMVINLNGLHTVRGRVRVPSPKSTNMTTDIMLFEEAGADRQAAPRLLARNAVLRADGSFELSFVPAGKYLLRVDSYPETGSIEDGTATNNNYTIKEEPLSITVLDQDLDVGEVVSSIAEIDKSTPPDAPPADDQTPKR